MRGWTVVVHGGAGAMVPGLLPPADEQGALAGLQTALEQGAAILRNDGTALDAVEVAVRVLEENPHFNAGRGSALNWDGRVECDAAIMDGRDRSAGAVAGVTATKSPVALARAVMTRSPHVLLAGAGADAFSRLIGLEQAEPDWFEIEERRRQLAEIKARDGQPFDSDMKYGTVGAVALDGAGHLAAATSTGGLTAKRWGRIGDSPLIGAGTYADDRAAAVSCTGSGEHFIRTGAAHELCARIRLAGETSDVAMDAVMNDLAAIGGKGGLIAITPNGRAHWAFNTPGMYRGIIAADRAAEVAIYADTPAPDRTR